MQKARTYSACLFRGESFVYRLRNVQVRMFLNIAMGNLKGFQVPRHFYQTVQIPQLPQLFNIILHHHTSRTEVTPPSICTPPLLSMRGSSASSDLWPSLKRDLTCGRISLRDLARTDANTGPRTCPQISASLHRSWNTQSPSPRTMLTCHPPPRTVLLSPQFPKLNSFTRPGCDFVYRRGLQGISLRGRMQLPLPLHLHLQSQSVNYRLSGHYSASGWLQEAN
jgi:hypothetical protein